jgi:UDP-N-acetylmuramoyl-tripeptide--D-alanyl-D-alanine ligase
VISSSIRAVADLSGARIAFGDPTARVRGVALERHEIGPRRLFVALDHAKAEVKEAFERGAVVLAGARPRRVSGPLLIAGDVLAALQRLAKHHLGRAPCLTIGVTGSVGKTTIKEMIARVLEPAFDVHKTSLNRNGQLGVPATVLLRPLCANAMVLEMGISMPKEMARLVEIVTPSIAVLSRLSPVHAANFPSFRALIREKKRLLEGRASARPELAIVHVDAMPLVAPLPTRAITYGLRSEADVFATDIAIDHRRAGDRPGATFLVHGIARRPFPIRLPLFGSAMIENALAALAVGHALGVRTRKMVDALESLVLDVPMRQAWHKRNGITIIDDTYNAAPASMIAALELLETAPIAGRRIAVLGDMLELGRGTREHHRALAPAVERATHHLFTIGPAMRHLHRAVRGVSAEHFDDLEALGRRLLCVARAGDAVLFKASRGIALERAVTAFEAARHVP